MRAGFFDVAGEPPADGLHLGIPGIMGAVGVAVVAGALENFLHRGRRCQPSGDVVRAGFTPGRVFLRPDKLDAGEDDREGE